MNHALKTFFITLLVILNCSAIYGMEQKSIKVKVEDFIYELTLKQAMQSETIQQMLKKHKNLEEPLELPSIVTQSGFKYVYYDLRGENYEVEDLDDKTVGQMYNAAYYLKIPWLIEKYIEITVDRINEITLEVGNKKYILTVAQAKKSKTLLHSLEDVEDYSIPIPISQISKDVFEYIYNDLTDAQYNPYSLSVEMLFDLINSANYLDAPKLLQKYQNYLIERLIKVDTEEELKKYIHLIQEKLPEEMQEPLSRFISAKATELFKMLSISKIKPIPEINYPYKDIVVSSDKTKVLLDDGEFTQLVDLVTNTVVWKKKLTIVRAMFSSDNSKVVIIHVTLPGKTLQVFSTTEDKELLNKKFSFNFITPIGFFSAINKIVVPDGSYKKLFVIDSNTGALSFDLSLLEKTVFKACYYDADSQLMYLKIKAVPARADNKDQILIVDMKTGAIVKTKTNTESEHYDVSPDGKKIVLLSKELISIENTFNDKSNFSWVFPKPLASIPKISSFSNDNKLFSLVSSSVGQGPVFILDSSSGKTVWSQANLMADQTSFSPNAQWFTVESLHSISNVNLVLKKEAWAKEYLENILRLYYLSDDIISFLLERDNKKQIIFCDIKTGQILEKIDFKKDASIYFQINFQNNLFVGTDKFYGPRIVKKQIICFDISPLSIFAFLNRSYIPLDQALAMYYSIKMISNDYPVPVSSPDLEPIYNELPQEIKSFIDNYNKQPRIHKSEENK